MKYPSLAAIFSLTLLTSAILFAADDPAKGHYESALFFLQSQKYQQAIDDLNFIAKSFPQSPYADDALLKLGQYYFEQEKNLDMALQSFKQIKDNYTESNSAPAAYYYLGQIYLTRRGPADLDEAFASFERVTRVFPSSSWVDKSLVGAGTALKWRGEFEKAYEEFAKVKIRFADSPLAPEAQLQMGVCSLLQNQYLDAAYDFQQVIEHAPDSPEAADALDYNTLIYRLYIASPSDKSAYPADSSFSLTLQDLDEPAGLIIDSKRNVYLSDKDKKIVYIFDPTGKLSNTLSVAAPQGLFVDDRDKLYIANTTTVVSPGDEIVPFSVRKPAGKSELLEEIRSVAVDSSGIYLLVSEKVPGVLAYDKTGTAVLGPGMARTEKEYVKVFVNQRNQIFALDKQRKQISLHSPEGNLIFSLGPRGSGYDFDRIEDFAVDRANNLYVLTKNPRGVFIFSATGKLLRFIGSEKNGAISFEDGKLIAVDPSGAIFILDKGQRRVLKIG
jgi:TolA-binding protein